MATTVELYTAPHQQPARQDQATRRIRQTVRKVGFWSALLTTGAIVAFDVSLILGVSGIPMRSFTVGASLLIAPAFLTLMVSIHRHAPPEQQMWTHVGLSFAIVYAALAAFNYFLQLTVVRQNPQAYAWLTMDFTPDSAFWALEILLYSFMGLAALGAVPVFRGVPLGSVVGWLFVANASFTLLGPLASLITANPLHWLVLVSLGVWALAFPIATALLAIVFRRAARREGQMSP